MLLITIEDEDSEKFGDTLAKEMGKALVETPVEAIEGRDRWRETKRLKRPRHQ